MTPEQRCRETQLLLMHMVDYWYEVDLHGGLGVSARFVEDGIFEGGGKPLVGREAIEAFYQWRIDRGERTSRHVITNFRADFHDDRNATTYCVMMLYAADGPPILPSTPPIIITDLVDQCVKLRRRRMALQKAHLRPAVPGRDRGDGAARAPRRNPQCKGRGLINWPWPPRR